MIVVIIIINITSIIIIIAIIITVIVFITVSSITIAQVSVENAESFESKSQIDELTLAVKDLKMVSNLIDRFNRIALPFPNAITIFEEVNKVKLKFMFIVVSNIGGPN